MRVAGEVFLLTMAYRETGPWTVTVLALLTLAVELMLPAMAMLMRRRDPAVEAARALAETLKRPAPPRSSNN